MAPDWRGLAHAHAGEPYAFSFQAELAHYLDWAVETQGGAQMYRPPMRASAAENPAPRPTRSAAMTERPAQTSTRCAPCWRRCGSNRARSSPVRAGVCSSPVAARRILAWETAPAENVFWSPRDVPGCPGVGRSDGTSRRGWAESACGRTWNTATVGMRAG